MLQFLYEAMDATICAETAMLLFLGSFVAVCVQVLLRKKTTIQEASQLPLSDGEIK